MIGIGGPQYRWREMHQSYSRKRTVPLPCPSRSSQAVMSRSASLAGRPVHGPECTSAYPSVSVSASSIGASASCPARASTRVTGRPNLRAKAKSRSSCAGTAMMAPVPYSIST